MFIYSNLSNIIFSFKITRYFRIFLALQLFFLCKLYSKKVYFIKICGRMQEQSPKCLPSSGIEIIFRSEAPLWITSLLPFFLFCLYIWLYDCEHVFMFVCLFVFLSLRLICQVLRSDGQFSLFSSGIRIRIRPSKFRVGSYLIFTYQN